MKLTLPVALITTILTAAPAGAATIDMNDPRRAVGREADIRVDAQIPEEQVASGVPISVTYQVQNLTTVPIALAPKVASASYDPDEQTITVGIGSEIPDDGVLPQMVTIAPGEKKTFTVAASARFLVRTVATRVANVPRYVRVKVNVLRDIAPFSDLLERQRQSAAPQRLSDQLFDSWLDANETIFLNSLPVRYTPGAKRGPGADAEARSFDSSF